MTSSLPFVKGVAHGNDFLLVPESSAPEDGDSRKRLALRICDRREGVGADGLILHRVEDRRLAMKLWNSDGSTAEISGNGLRCLAAYAVDSGLVEGDAIEILTDAGVKRLTALGSQEGALRFRADMGAPRILSKGARLDGVDEELRVVTLSMGNPHCVVFTPVTRLSELGPALERHPLFPERTNVELVEVIGASAIRMRIWERGAGETASSGTGSAAAAVASLSLGRVASPVTVHCPGGQLRVEWSEGESALVEGEARLVAEGTYRSEGSER